MKANPSNPLLQAATAAMQAAAPTLNSPAATITTGKEGCDDKPGKAGDEEEEEEDPEVDPSKEPVETPGSAAAASPVMGRFDRAKLLLTGKVTLVNQIAALTRENSDLSAKNATLSASAARVPELEKQIEDLKSKQTTVSTGVRNELGKLGVTEAAAPAQVGASATGSALLEKYQSLTGAAKTAFWRENTAKLLAAEKLEKKATR